MLTRLILVVSGFVLLAAAQPEMREAAPTPSAAQANDATGAGAAEFSVWRADFERRMAALGHNQAAIDQIMLGLTAEPRVEAHLTAQAEFTKPIWRYVQDRLSPYSINKGRAGLSQNAALFAAIEAKFGAPKEIVTAIWGVESGYGAFTGDIDAPSALAAMAMRPERRSFAERQLEALINIIEKGYADRRQLKGSWSAAMGQTQFIPTTYLERAVDWDNDGHRDVWSSTADALASTAFFLKDAGWRTDEPWGVEVKLAGLAPLKYADSAQRPVSDFAKLGVKRANGAPWSAAELARAARLFLPAGRNGPAFLLFSNFDVIKEYNRSESYALGVVLLAEALAGRPGLRAPWPTSATILSPGDVRKLQAGLTALGYPAGELDGKIGTQTRIALHAFQTAQNLPSDGFPTPEALDQVVKAVAAPEKH